MLFAGFAKVICYLFCPNRLLVVVCRCVCFDVCLLVCLGLGSSFVGSLFVAVVSDRGVCVSVLNVLFVVCCLLLIVCRWLCELCVVCWWVLSCGSDRI